MHQIHTITCPGYFPDQGVALAGILDSAEENKDACAHQPGYNSVILPVHLQFLRSGNQETAVIELINAEKVANQYYRNTDRQFFLIGPFEAHAYVVPQKDVTYEA